MAKVFFCSICLCIFGCEQRSSFDHSTVSYDVSPDGKQIVFSSASGDLFLFDVSKQQINQLTKTPNIEITPTFSADGSFIVFASSTPDYSTSHIFRLSFPGIQITQLTGDDNAYDSSPRCSRDGSKIVFSRAHRYRDYSMGGKTWDDLDIYIMDMDGNNARRVTNQKYRGISPPHFGANGRMIYFSSRVERQDSSLYSATFRVSISDEQPPQNLTPDIRGNIGCASLASSPAVSPDGTKIVFVSDRNTKYDYDLWIMDLDGSNPTPLNLIRISERNALPNFAPDGERVFFLAESEKNVSSRPLYDLWVVDVTGKNPRRIADMGLFNKPLQWKPVSPRK